MMQRLVIKLKIQAPSLYWHLANKQKLTFNLNINPRFEFALAVIICGVEQRSSGF
jgi:hypothetical protein